MDGHIYRYTHNTDLTGVWVADENVDIEVVKNGDLVTMRIPSFLAASNASAAITAVTNFPAIFTPVGTIRQPFIVQDDGTVQTGLITFTAGGMAIHACPGQTDFTGSAGLTGAPHHQTISYIIN